MHSDENVYPDYDTFNPDRFKDDKSTMTEGHYTFGFGRRCVSIVFSFVHDSDFLPVTAPGCTSRHSSCTRSSRTSSRTTRSARLSTRRRARRSPCTLRTTQGMLLGGASNSFFLLYHMLIRFLSHFTANQNRSCARSSLGTPSMRRSSGASGRSTLTRALRKLDSVTIKQLDISSRLPLLMKSSEGGDFAKHNHNAYIVLYLYLFT